MAGSGGGGGGGGTGACAACKHQRRKCQPDCVLARYFPAEKLQAFHDVHRLFGVSNVLKLYHSVPPASRDALVHSLTFEAEMRRRHPVLGSLSLVRDLRSRIAAAHRDLSALRHQLHHHLSSPPPPPPPPPPPFMNLMIAEEADGITDPEALGGPPPDVWKMKDSKPFSGVTMDRQHTGESKFTCVKMEDSSKQLRLKAVQLDDDDDQGD